MTSLLETRKITDELKPFLSLSAAQTREIDILELKVYKEYHWNYIVSDATLKFTFLKGLLKILSIAQLKELKELRKKQKVKEQEQKKNRLTESLKNLENRFRNFKLDDKQLEQILASKANRKNLLMDRSKELFKQGIEYNLRDLSSAIDIEIFTKILSASQLDQYKDLLLEEEQGQKIWRIQHEKDRFKFQYAIGLNETQAELLIDHQDSIPKKDKNGEYFSEFEQAELTLQKAKLVLDKNQFKQYHTHHLRYLDTIKEGLRSSNSDHYLKQYLLIHDYLIYYLEHVLPSKCESRKRIDDTLTDKQKKIVEDLRVVYFRNLNESMELFNTQHFRHNQDLVPNAVLEYQTRDKLNRINPNLFYLDAIKIAEGLRQDSLLEKLQIEHNNLQPIFKKLKDFQIGSYERNGGKYGGPMMKIPMKKGEEYFSHLGFLVLEPELKMNLRKIETR